MSREKIVDALLTGTLLRTQWLEMLQVATSKAAEHNRLANALSGPSERAGQRARRGQAKKWEAIVGMCSDILNPSEVAQ